MQIEVMYEGQPATYAAVVKAWKTDADLRTKFNDALAATPFESFRWETPAVNTAAFNRVFECVVLDAPGLAEQPDAESFAEHFANARGAQVVEFTNLGGGAQLVVPCPVVGHEAYGHLGAFVRQAPPEQRDVLWQSVGDALGRRVNAFGMRKVWLSTAGAGVSWLHVRLDDRPKYYHYAKYRDS